MKNLEPQIHTVENPKGQLRFFGGGQGLPFKKQQGVIRLFAFLFTIFFPKLPSRQGTKSYPRHPPVIMYAKAESPRLKLKAKASIWLVLFPLRSLNTVNERPFFSLCKTRPQKELSLDVLDSLFQGRLKYKGLRQKQTSLSILIEGCNKQSLLLHFVDVVLVGFKSILVL